jgi:molybdate transport system substrate-binding protein
MSALLTRRKLMTLLMGASLMPSLVIAKSPRRLLIYCAVSTAKPMAEIVERFKQVQQSEVVIDIVHGGSQELLDTLVSRKQGDFFVPGSPEYITEYSDPSLFGTTIEMGHNQAVFMVQKGNPKAIKADLQEFLRTDITTVIGVERSSIGLESKKMLEKIDRYSQVMLQVSAVLADARQLSNAIAKGKADLAINWRSAYHFVPDQLEVIELPNAAREKILMAQLASALDTELCARYDA